jgi:UDP-N-acetylglucosamine--N-acetylmuramyl-(pentapeptide) pyrophosphoryl-undecaprenol N-acetylglucosamine transferase
MQESKKRKFKIVLTGGHAATTALAVYQALKKKDENCEVFFVGSKYAIEGSRVFTLEYESLPKKGITFIPITAGRLQRKFTLYTIPSLFKIPVGFLQSFNFLWKVKPDVVLSFGGYAAFPVVVAAKLLGIPVVLHEQTAAAGRSNLAAYRFATKIALSRQSSLEYFPEKSVVIGNPVTEEISKIKKKTAHGNPPVIFITGGSRGSQNLNKAVKDALPDLLKKYKVIHQTGELDYKEFDGRKRDLSLGDRYEVFPRVMPEKMAEYLSDADLVIGRSGANTVSEALVAGRPAIYVPLPISYLDEQTKNAMYAKSLGVAEVINQKDLTGTRLERTVEKIIKNYSSIQEKFKESFDADSSDKLANLLLELGR